MKYPLPCFPTHEIWRLSFFFLVLFSPTFILNIFLKGIKYNPFIIMNCIIRVWSRDRVKSKAITDLSNAKSYP